MSPTRKLCFASDNTAGIHPEILKAIQEANSSWASAYGDDDLTHRVAERLRTVFGSNSRSFLVFNGTGANVLGIAAVIKPFQAVLTAESSHLHVDECGAFERFTGSKVLPIPARDGKLRPELLQAFLQLRGDVHKTQPRVISISQSTEHGTLYAPDEVRALAEFAHSHGMLLHVDGARFTNAVAALGLSLAGLSGDLGVDLLSFGGTKHGLLAGEAVVFFNRPEAEDFPFVRKQGLQLASKMRFIAAQFEAFLEGDLWLTNARHANAMAALLHERIRQKIEIAYPVQANVVFAILPDAAIARLQESFYFYVWQKLEGGRSIVRLMTSFQTSEREVTALAEALLDDDAR